MNTVRIRIEGTGSFDDRVNCAREAIARDGHQVGDFTPTRNTEEVLEGKIEVDQHLVDAVNGGQHIAFGYGGIYVELTPLDPA